MPRGRPKGTANKPKTPSPPLAPAVMSAEMTVKLAQSHVLIREYRGAMTVLLANLQAMQKSLSVERIMQETNMFLMETLGVGLPLEVWNAAMEASHQRTVEISQKEVMKIVEEAMREN